MRLPFKSGRRRALAVASATALAAGALAVATVTPAQAQGSCDVDAVIGQWGDGNGGFTAHITITASGVNGWELAFTMPGASLIQGWSANWSGGPNFTATNLSWNASLGTTTIGFNGSGYSGDPTSFTLNGVTCGGVTPPTSEPPTSEPPTSEPPTSEPPTSEPPTSPPPGQRVDNPYVGADVYVNPDWRQLAIDGGAPSSIYEQPTAVWLDRISAIDQGSEGNATGLRDHLENAAAQDAANGATPLVFQVVIYNLPGRDCAALASNGELPATAAGLATYQSDYIDVIRDIMADFPDLRISAIVEIDSLPNLVTNTGALGPEEPATENCNTVDSLDLYQDGIAYALNQLGGLGNVYNYIDLGHHGWLGWDDNFLPFADLVMNEVTNQLADPAYIHGFISNVANTGASIEPFFDIDDVVGGMPIRQVPVVPGDPDASGWIDWNRYIDEVSYAAAYGQEFESRFGRHVSILIDTSRNGWGGPNRPTGTSTSTDPVTYMHESRIDRRFHLGNWCNASGAGIGESPQANPEPGIDAYIWVKPPGESDGSSELIPTGPDNPNGKGFDEMCDPDYGGNARNVFMPTGALPNAPVSGAWFQAQFDELLANAWPPLSQR
jgi:cellulose 1,4-beta-cellobiosidase